VSRRGGLPSDLPVLPRPHARSVSFCTFLAHEYPELVHKVVMINGGGPTALEPSICSIFSMPTCVLHCLSPCLAWSFLK
jgi:abhydrolase domain-containing protein 8